jgi:hypothetical protein
MDEGRTAVGGGAGWGKKTIGDHMLTGQTMFWAREPGDGETEKRHF